MNKSRKIIAIVSGIVIVVAIIVGFILFLQPKTFSLSKQFYNSSEPFRDASVEDLRKLIDESKSFAVFVYQPACRTSDDFEKILKDFSAKYNITFLKTPFAELKTSKLIPDLKYYPSMLLYRDGKLVTFLRADSDDDLKVYQNAEDFTAWWQKYIKN